MAVDRTKRAAARHGLRLRPLVAAIALLLAQPVLAGPESLPLKAERFLHMPKIDDSGAIFVRADEITGKADEPVEARGNVEARTRTETFTADYLRYDPEKDELYGLGSVRMHNRLNHLAGPELLYRRESATGYLHQPKFEIDLNASRGDASELIFAGPNRYHLDDARYTTCRADNDAWYLKLGDLEIDQNRHVGTAHNATVYFQKVPILWAPWADFPLDNQRKSGFLSPSFGSTGKRGLEMSEPYYWNIAPNYDATFTPRIMTKRGLELGAEFRFLQPNRFGDMNVEVLPDRTTGTNRYQLALHETETFLPNLHSILNLNKVSDDNYFVDLADRIAITSQVELPREGLLTYDLPYLALAARVQKFQTLQDPAAPIVPPYERVPQLVANSLLRDWHGFDVTGLGEYDRFQHPTLITGQRLVYYPSVAYPWRSSAFFITPKLGIHLSKYVLDASSGDLTDTTRALFHDSSRSVPIASLDSGVVFERDWNLFGRHFIQTLEPRAYFLYVPFRKQDQIPIFDSALADFNYAQLFSENRYIGNDRIGDARQITLAVSSRLLDPVTGDERLRTSIGQRYYFADQQVTLNEPLRAGRRSDYLLTATGRLSERWLVDGGYQYDTEAKHTDQLNFGVRYQPELGKTLSAGYRYTRELLDAQGLPTQIKQVDLAGQWPIGGRWYAEARWNYSLFDHKVLEAVAGLEYNGGCWALRILGQRVVTTTTAAQGATSSIFFQLELNGLGGLGTNPLEVLQRNIPNYFKFNAPVRSTEAPGQWYQPNY